MRLRWFPAGIVLFAFSVLVPSQESFAQGGSVSGRVFCSDTNTPCRYAIVSLRPVKATAGEAGEPQYITSTDLDGEFRITHIPPGLYRVSCSLLGYLPEESSSTQSKSGGANAESRDPITIGPDTFVTLAFTLQHASAISGTIRYDDGAPAINIPIRIFRKSEQGKWQPYISPIDTGTLGFLATQLLTDDQGHYRLEGLPSGSYTVEASLPDPRAIGGGLVDATGSRSATLKIYSGNVFDISQAQVNTVGDGEELAGIDIIIPTTNLYAVQGVVLDKSTGLHVRGGKVVLVDQDDHSISRSSTIDPNGVFSFDHVRSGSYMLEISASSAGEAGTNYTSVDNPLLVTGDMTNLSYELPFRR